MQVGHVSSNNQAMLHRIRQMEAERGNNRKAVAEFQDQLTALNSLNLRLHGRVACLKHAMKQV